MRVRPHGRVVWLWRMGVINGIKAALVALIQAMVQGVAYGRHMTDELGLEPRRLVL